MTYRIDGRDESDYARLFTQLRRDDAARAPSFHATLGAARGRRRRTHRRARLRLLAAGVMAVILGVGATHALGRVLERRAFLTSLLANEQWIGPTDFLLDAPGSALLRTVPPLGSVEYLIPSTTLIEGRRP